MAGSKEDRLDAVVTLLSLQFMHNGDLKRLPEGYSAAGTLVTHSVTGSRHGAVESCRLTDG